MMDIC